MTVEEFEAALEREVRAQSATTTSSIPTSPS